MEYYYIVLIDESGNPAFRNLSDLLLDNGAVLYKN